MQSITLKVFNSNDDSATVDLDWNDKFMKKGAKMYAQGVEEMIELLTKQELKHFIAMLKDTKKMNRANVLLVPLSKALPDMNKVARYRLKKKLLDNGLIVEHKGKIMISPYMLAPRNDKNIKNFQWLVQRAYKRLVDDKDHGVEGIDDFIEYIFE